VGIVGSLAWNARYGYCYGWELVAAIRRSARSDVAALVIGGGEGLDRLRELAGDELGRRVFLPGPVTRGEVTAHLGAMDLGSLPQSVDQVGSFRYTTKLSEYVAARLPIVTGQIPAAYDVADQWAWRLPGDAPWSPEYVDALASLLDGLTEQALAERRAGMPDHLEAFDLETQASRVTAFVRDVAARRNG